MAISKKMLPKGDMQAEKKRDPSATNLTTHDEPQINKWASAGQGCKVKSHRENKIHDDDESRIMRHTPTDGPTATQKVGE